MLQLRVILQWRRYVCRCHCPFCRFRIVFFRPLYFSRLHFFGWFQWNNNPPQLPLFPGTYVATWHRACSQQLPSFPIFFQKKRNKFSGDKHRCRGGLEQLQKKCSEAILQSESNSNFLKDLGHWPRATNFWAEISWLELVGQEPGPAQAGLFRVGPARRPPLHRCSHFPPCNEFPGIVLRLACDAVFRTVKVPESISEDGQVGKKLRWFFFVGIW